MRHLHHAGDMRKAAEKNLEVAGSRVAGILFCIKGGHGTRGKRHAFWGRESKYWAAFRGGGRLDQC